MSSSRCFSSGASARRWLGEGWRRRGALADDCAPSRPPLSAANSRADGGVYNHPKRDPAVVGTSYTWELRDLPPIEREPYSPALTSIAPWLAVSPVPAPGARTGIGKTFESWPDVARWLSELAAPQALASSELSEKARSLTLDAGSEFEQLQAIGRYVQGVKYVSIETGVGS